MSDELETVDESIFDFLGSLRRRPGLYFGKTSLVRLQAYLFGYQAGLAKVSKSLKGEEDFHEFHDWVAKQLGFSSSTVGWCNMILEKSASDEAAFHRFFELLEEFKKERSIRNKSTP